MISSHPDVIGPFPDYTMQNVHDLQQIEMEQNLNFNLWDLLQTILDEHNQRLCQIDVQNGGTLTDCASTLAAVF